MRCRTRGRSVRGPRRHRDRELRSNDGLMGTMRGDPGRDPGRDRATESGTATEAEQLQSSNVQVKPLVCAVTSGAPRGSTRSCKPSPSCRRRRRRRRLCTCSHPHVRSRDPSRRPPARPVLSAGPDRARTHFAPTLMNGHWTKSLWS